MPNDEFRFWPYPTRKERAVMRAGVDAADVAVLQFPTSVFSRKDVWSWRKGTLTQQQMRVFYAALYAAKASGCIVWFEALKDAALDGICDHYVGFRAFFIAQTDLAKQHFEETISRLVGGTASDRDADAKPTDGPGGNRQEGEQPKKRRRKRGAPATGAKSFWELTLNDLRATCALFYLGDEDQPVYQAFKPEGADDDGDAGPAESDGDNDGPAASEPAQGGFFVCFSVLNVLNPELESANNRMEAWSVKPHPKTGHDPRDWSAYVRESSDGTTVFMPLLEYAEERMRILAFSPKYGMKPWISSIQDFDTLCVPWRRPTESEIRDYLRHMISEGGLYIPEVETLSLEDLETQMMMVDPWDMGKPIMASSTVELPIRAPDAVLYPDTARWHKEIVDRLKAATAAVQAGKLSPSSLRSIESHVIQSCMGLFSETESEGFMAMPFKLYAEARSRVVALNTKMGMLSTKETRRKATLRRLIAFYPQNAVTDLHPHCIDPVRDSTCYWVYGGFTASQVMAITLLMSLSGANFVASYAKLGNYVLLAGSPGGGKTHVSDEAGENQPACARIKNDSMSEKGFQYSRGMLDGCFVVRDEAAGQNPDERGLVMTLNAAVSQGWLNHLVAVFSPQEDEDGRTTSVGDAFGASTGARIMLVQNTNGKIHDGFGVQRGADESRRITIDVVPEQPRRESSARGAEICEASREVNILVTCGVGLAASLSAYGAIIPENPNSMIWDVFKAMVLERVPSLRAFVAQNRRRGALLAIAQNLWRRRVVRDYMFPGRNTAAAYTFINRKLSDPRFQARLPITLEFAEIMRTTPLSGVDLIVALGLMKTSPTAMRQFMSIMIESLKFKHSAFVKAEAVEDEGYLLTTFSVNSKMELPATFITLAERDNLPGVIIDRTLKQATSERVYGGKTAVKIESTIGSTAAVMVHEATLENGIQYATAGQKMLIAAIVSWLPEVYYDYETQEEAFLPRARLNELLMPKETYDAARELYAMTLWRWRGKPCIWTREDTATGGPVNPRVAEVVDDSDHLARADGPLLKPNGEPACIRPKQLAAALGMSLDFLKLAPKILAGEDAYGQDERKHLDACINRFLLACGVPVGTKVMTGLKDNPELKDDIVKTLTVTAETFSFTAKNSLHVPPMGASMGLLEEIGEDSDDGDDCCTPLFSSEDEHVEFTNTSNFHGQIRDIIRREEADRLKARVELSADESDDDGIDADLTTDPLRHERGAPAPSPP